jgi:hypothetical protein
MKTPSIHLMRFLLLCAISILPLSCTTQDVYPTVTLTLSAENIDADGGSAQLIAKLNGTTAKTILLPLQFAGSAVQGVHFSSSAASITVQAGMDSGFVTLTAIANSDTGRREILVGIGEAAGVLLQTPGSLSVGLVNANADRDNDGVPDILDHCPDDPGPVENDGCPWLGLLVNEVLYDPPAGLPGDANGDGIRDPIQDEVAVKRLLIQR